MKLFQNLLVAGTGFSLLTSLAAPASELHNLEAMNSYKRSEKKAKRFDNNSFVNEVNNDLAITEGRDDGFEVKQKYIEAGTFSDTTTADQKLVFSLGGAYAENDADLDGQIQGSYTYTMNLNSSFSGDDNLYIRLKSGNHTGYSVKKGEQNSYLSAGNSNGDNFKVDKIWYSTPVLERGTVWIGPRIENYYMHATTPSIYKPVLKAFTLGGNAAAYGASTSPGAGYAYKFDNGLAFSTNFTSKDVATGFLNFESDTSWATQIGYTKPRYSVSAILNKKYHGWADTSYYTSDDGASRGGDGNSSNYGLRAWLRPGETGGKIPSISLGYDTSKTDEAEDDTTSAYFVGLNWQDIFVADDRVGIAFGQPQMRENETIDPFLYEIYYEYKVNDSVTLTPTIFGGTHENANDNETDMVGYVLNTSFKF